MKLCSMRMFYAYGYEEDVPIEIYCIDKSGITGTKLMWKAERELRHVAETYPEGSRRNLIRRRDMRAIGC